LKKDKELFELEKSSFEEPNYLIKIEQAISQMSDNYYEI
jgi:hypothetical protein